MLLASLPLPPARSARASGRVRGLFAALVLAVTLTGCGVRLETPEPSPPTPDAAEIVRAEAVADAESIAEAATAARTDPTGAAVVERLEQVAAGSGEHADLLGGPAEGSGKSDATDTDGATDPADAAAEVGDVAAAVSSLMAGYDRATAGLGTVTPEVSRLLGSIALWRALAAHELAGALPDPAAAGLPTGGLDATSLGLASFRGADDLVRGLDAAGYAYEVLAAREGDDARRADWRDRGEELRSAGDLVAERSGVAGTAADPREAVYDVGALLATEPLAGAAAVETDVARLWVASDLPASSRDIAVEAALAALLRARSLAPTAPLDSPAALLPGLGGHAGDGGSATSG